MGEAELIAGSASGASQDVEKLVQALMELDLPVQDKLFLLRKSLQVKIMHLARISAGRPVLPGAEVPYVDQRREVVGPHCCSR